MTAPDRPPARTAVRGASRAPRTAVRITSRSQRALPLVKQVIRELAIDSDFWFDDVWIADRSMIAHDH